MKTSMMTVFGVLSLAGAYAETTTLYWANTGTSAANYYDVANWQYETENPADAAPITAGYAAHFPDIDRTKRSVNLMTSGVKGQNPVIDAISGGEFWRLVLAGGNNSWGRFTRSVSVADVNGFKGEWYSSGTLQTLDLSNATEDQKLEVVYPNYQFPIKVPEGVTAEIGYVRGTAGAIAKEGAGKLKIDVTLDSESVQLQLNEGEVELGGTISAENDIIKKAYIHFDANLVEGTMETYTDEASRKRVTKWYDANGSGRYASTWDNSSDGTDSHIKLVNAPFITDNGSTTGLKVMDFGSNSAYYNDMEALALYGPTNCVLRFDKRITNVREIIWVGGHNINTAPAFGDSTGYSLTGSDSYIFNYGHTITNGGGAVWFNGSCSSPMPGLVSGLYRYSTPTDTYSPNYKALRLHDVKFGTDQNFYYLGSDRLYRSSGGGTGGITMGEALIFTNALTSAERQLVNDYLMKRWFSAYPHSQFRNVYAAAGTAISVPAGRTAKIDNLIARGKVVKKGEGTLVIGRSVQNTEIEIQGGDVKFEPKTFTVDDSAPAGTPQFWYDGDKADCFVSDENGVTAWKEKRGEYETVRQATRYFEDGKVTGYPQMDTTSCPGHTVLSFPEGSAFSLPGTIEGAYAYQREAFIVFSFTGSTYAKNYNFLPNSSYACVRGAYRFLDPSCADDLAGGGVYTIDGVPEYPMESATGTRAFEVGRWYVASAAVLSSMGMNCLARDGGRSRVGGIRVGEVITYSGALTEAERRQTIAYLMKKWLGEDLPEANAPSKNPDVEFGEEVDAVINAENNVTYNSVSGGNGNLVKKGEGAVTVTEELEDSLGSITVEAGSLTINKAPEPPDRSIFHFDAMNSASFTEYYIDEQGRTNVSQWADTRANGVHADHIAPYSPSGTNMLYVADPVVCRMTGPDGVERPFMDFLSNQGRNVNPPTGAGLEVKTSQNGSPAKGVEVHCVVCPSLASMDIFGTTESNVGYFKRGLQGRLFRMNGEIGAVPSDVENSSIWVNGAVGSASTKINSGSYDAIKLVSVAFANGASYNMGALSYWGSNSVGGNRYGEYIVFDQQLDPSEREFLQQKLMHKWFGDEYPMPIWYHYANEINVAAGAELTINGSMFLADVKGAGDVTITKMDGIKRLWLDPDGNGVLHGLTVNGTAAFDPEVEVKISGENVNLAAGEHTIFTATTLEGVPDFSGWSVVGSLKPGRSYSFVKSGNSIKLLVRKPGSVLVFE